MAETEMVSEDALNAGRALIAAADREHVPLRAAFWLLDNQDKSWRLVLEEEESAKLGQREFASAILAAVAKIADDGVRNAAMDLVLESVALATRPHPIAELLRPVLGAAKSVLRARLRNTRVGDAIVEGAVLYRLEQAQTI